MNPCLVTSRDRAAARCARRRPAEQDRLTARLAELHHVRELLAEAEVLVGTGWVQHAWVAVEDAQGRRHHLSAHQTHLAQIHLAEGRPLSGACLVGGVVFAAGGPPAVHTQLVQRTLDLLWHTLHEDARQPVRWCPPPAVRAAHVRDLTRWNDHRRRTSSEVLALLRSATRLADAHVAAGREQLGLVAAR